MALTSTIFRAELQISDIDRHYYETHALTLARHPSETDERMMVRLLVFALHASSDLVFAGDISSSEEPALWAKDLTGQIEQWFEIGQPDVKVVRKAAGRAREVWVYAYGRGSVPWWAQHAADFARFNNLSVVRIADDTTRDLAAFAVRNMKLQCLVQDGAATLSNATHSVLVQTETLKNAGQ